MTEQEIISNINLMLLKSAYSQRNQSTNWLAQSFGCPPVYPEYKDMSWEEFLVWNENRKQELKVHNNKISSIKESLLTDPIYRLATIEDIRYGLEVELLNTETLSWEVKVVDNFERGYEYETDFDEIIYAIQDKSARIKK